MTNDMTKKQAHYYGFCQLKCIHWQRRKCVMTNPDKPEMCPVIKERRDSWQKEMMGGKA